MEPNSGAAGYGPVSSNLETRSRRPRFRYGLLSASVLSATLGVIVSPKPAAAATLTYVRNIQTRPFIGTSTSMNDNEGLAYVASENSLWVIDDSRGRLHEVDRTTGELGQTITASQFQGAKRVGSTETAGTVHSGDLEAVAYDVGSDTLYAFSGTCCSSSDRPAVFRLKRPSRGGTFTIDSWQPLQGPYDDLSGAEVRDGVIWAGYRNTIVAYDYVTNTATTPSVISGAGTIYGVGFSPSGSEMWLALKGNVIRKYTWSSKAPVSGFDFSMSSLGTRDARAVTQVGSEIYVSDGYDFYGSTINAFGIRVYDLGGGGGVSVPVASFTVAPSSGVAPLAVNFTDTSTNVPTTWSWNFGDGNTSTLRNPSHTYTTPGTYTVRLTASNSAGSNTSGPISVTVNAPTLVPVASFTATPGSGVAPLAVNFTDTSTNVPTSWSWNFGDGTTSTLRNPSHTYTTPGAYTVRLTATNSAGSNISPPTTITVNAPTLVPVASFTATPATGVAPLIVNFTDTSTNVPTSWSWNFGDGTTSTLRNPSRTYATPGTYTVRLTATNSAGSNISPPMDIVVSPSVVTPVASFTATPTSGAAPLTVSFTDTSTNGPTSWLWDFGDGRSATTRNPTRVFPNPGTFNVTLTATNSAGSNVSQVTVLTVTAPAAPVASFTATPTSGATPLTVSFTDTSSNTPTSWLWDFGDGNTSTVRNPSYTYTSVGTYVVTLTATNATGSNTSGTTSIEVTPPVVLPPVASFTATPTSGAPPLAVTFTDTSTNAPTSWSWDFGDGNTSTSQNPTHTYTSAGTYTVVLTAANAQGSDPSSPTTVTVASAGESRTFTPTDDAYVDSTIPTTPKGTGSTLYNVESSSKKQRSYLRFNVTGVTGSVVSAKLRIYVTDGTDNGAAWFRIPESGWTENTLTWANAPAVGGTSIGNPGVVTDPMWLEFDVKGVVTGNGVVSFANLPESVNAEKYSTKEGVNAPQLVVVYG